MGRKKVHNRPKSTRLAKPALRPESKATGRAQSDGDVHWLTVVGARRNNLKNITAEFPLGRFVCVTGVSGSGKSSLVNDIIRETLNRDLNGAVKVQPGEHDRIDGVEHLDKVIDIDQSPIGRTPRSNAATYIKVFDEIRTLFAKLPDARIRGYKPGRFSFNVHTGQSGGGRCEACEGNGSNKMEMELLADVWITCPMCGGRRFNRETLQILYKGKAIADVLEMDVQEALTHFEGIPKIAAMLRTLHDVGLDYLKLGQSSATLSGGEAQRIKLARELVKRSTGRTLYILDEPTTGLHFHDIKKLLSVLHGFVDAGNSVMVIEHNLDVIKTADWVIDLGPEGGDAGGHIVACGTPEKVATSKRSHTGAVLRELFARRNRQGRTAVASPTPSKGKGATGTNGANRERDAATRNGRADRITVVGARQHNLKDITVEIPRGRTTVCAGPSGSGKSSFAIDTVYTEGQRRYVESLSAYARQFLGQLQAPRVDHVHGLSPAICIEQKNTSKSPRSTVGTVTEIHDYLRVLWARIGKPYCPQCKTAIGAQSSDEIVERVLAMGEGLRVLLLAPIAPSGNETFEHLFARQRANGYRRVRIDGAVHELEAVAPIDGRREHKVEVVVDRVVIRRSQASRITDSVEQALSVGQGVMIAQVVVAESKNAKTAPNVESAKPSKRPVKKQPPRGRKGESPTALGNGEIRFSRHRSCGQCGTSFDELTPHHFSFNSRLGWCEACEGLGVQQGASPAAVVIHPTRSVVDGAIVGWGSPPPQSKLFRLIERLADHIGFPVDRPWNELAEPQRMALLHGCGNDWIADSPTRSQRRSTECDDLEGLRIQWRGFFPAIARATRVSWQYRKRLEDLVTEVACDACYGGRLSGQSSAVRMGGATLHEVCTKPLGECLSWFEHLRLDPRKRKIAGELLHEVTSRLRFLVEVGLDYVTLHRTASTLSGGEAQRIQLASQIGTGLTGLLYVLDEPTIGLHPRDNGRLIQALNRLRDLGNTLLVVEHDREVIDAADHVLDFGPGAGSFGGEVTAAASPCKLRSKRASLTGRYLAFKESIVVPANRRPVPPPPRVDVELDPEATAHTDERSKTETVQWLTVHGARENNLKEIDVSFPLGRFVCVTGVSGSGKSSLVTSILHRALAARIHRAGTVPGGHDRISGVEFIDKVINVDQSPIGNTPTSNPATYTGVFDLVRELFAKLPLSKIRGYSANRFSFNRAGGRCEACSGMGRQCIEMHFLPDVWVECDDCKGARYVTETLAVEYRGKHIADVLELRVTDALAHFRNVPKLKRMLKTLDDVGLGYVQLGQPAPTLSGGEAQRVKLAAELGRPSTGKTLYILDEPTTGLHFDDLKKLLGVLQRLVDLGNTCICIEHNLDVIKTADWIIDLGPEAGGRGGEIVACGTPEYVAAIRRSHTGAALRPVLEAGPREERSVYDPARDADLRAELDARDRGFATGDSGCTVADDGADEVRMPWERNGRAWHTIDHVATDGTPVHWDTAVLTWLVDVVEPLGEFLPTEWNQRSCVEIAAAKNKQWFAHFLTGGRDLLEVGLRVPHGMFNERALQTQLKIKSLDDRGDLPIYGGSRRVRVSPVSKGWGAIRMSLRDFKDIAKAPFRAFLRDAAEGYFKHLQLTDSDSAAGKPWKTQGKDWHLSQKGINRRHTVRWSPNTLMMLIGRFRALQRDLVLDWHQQTSVQLAVPGESHAAAKIVTNIGRGLRVEVRAPRGLLTPAMMDRMGEDPEIKARGIHDSAIFWIKTVDRMDPKQLRDVWQRCRKHASTGASLRSSGVASA